MNLSVDNKILFYNLKLLNGKNLTQIVRNRFIWTKIVKIGLIILL
jgi:hypothetical protein